MAIGAKAQQWSLDKLDQDPYEAFHSVKFLRKKMLTECRVSIRIRQ
jgi:hypothetical protein